MIICHMGIVSPVIEKYDPLRSLRISQFANETPRARTRANSAAKITVTKPEPSKKPVPHDLVTCPNSPNETNVLGSRCERVVFQGTLTRIKSFDFLTVY
ncbi:hypothetical protein AG1IA_10023 [Rhizoctonia solani AG-1 IA]|uniref:Uncharacterized protein n=1 Tax=Thanatephorus cucumeris (strain AG1-IA) TaxID=983506 RepID=L8WGU8_THACA|nr:hypothetical protein AG1IA_10023 [Rhizoctonia solani AG-1 IA]